MTHACARSESPGAPHGTRPRARVPREEHLHRSIRALGALAVAGAFVGATSAGASAATPRTALPGSQPDWATPAAQVGTVPASESKTFWVYLKLRNEGELDQRIANTSDPSSAQYGQYLT